MAGIEIIGLVLGALQLTISALENYHRGLAPLKDYIRYDNTLKSLRTRLRIQQDLFEGTLQCLLFEELSDGQAKSLFPDANLDVDISLWRSPEIEAKLHRKLDTKYQNFVDVIEEMDVLMRQLKKKLNVDTEEKVKYDLKLAKPLLSPCCSQIGMRNCLRPCCQDTKEGNGNGEKYDEALDAKKERLSYKNSRGTMPLSPNLSNNERFWPLRRKLGLKSS